MSAIPFKAAFLDARLQGMAGRLGLQRPYFMMRERARAHYDKIDLVPMRTHGAIFIHVPKCAGTTIISQIPLAAGHRSAEFFSRYAPDLWQSAFTFGFSRSPYERLVSAFHYLRSDKTSRRDKAWGDANLRQFADFQAFTEGLQSSRVRHQVMGWLHFLPQVYYICDASNKILVDFVGRTETFNQDIETINARANLSLEPLRKRHVPRPNRQAYYTAKSAKLVEEIYGADFETFGFKTGLY